MFMASNHIHLICLRASSEKTHLEILVFCHLLYYILLHSFALLLFLSLVHLLAVKFWPQSRPTGFARNIGYLSADSRPTVGNVAPK